MAAVEVAMAINPAEHPLYKILWPYLVNNAEDTTRASPTNQVNKGNTPSTNHSGGISTPANQERGTTSSSSIQRKAASSSLSDQRPIVTFSTNQGEAVNTGTNNGNAALALPSPDSSSGAVQAAAGSEWDAETPRKNAVDLNYMHRPPTILPNYGKRKGVLKLKTNVPRVLLFDNVTQQSMLQVELSGLQSQRHKLDRELNMQAKSFMRRRQIKDRMLKNLTKVHHDQDYSEFEQEYFSLQLQDARDFRDANKFPLRREKRSFLPKIPGIGADADGKGAKHPQSNRKRKAAMRHDGATVTNGSPAEQDTSLPQIKVSAPGVTSSSPGPSAQSPSLLQQFSPRRTVGYRFQRDEAGITTLFHAHHEVDEEQQAEMSKQPESEPTPSADGTDTASARPDTDSNNNTIGDERLQASEDGEVETYKKPAYLMAKRNRPFQKVVEDTEPSLPAIAEPIYEPQVNTEIPTLDYRFQDLQDLLVKQVPPNDGFIELSPSFSRESGPVVEIRRQLENLGLIPPIARTDSAGSHESRETLRSASSTSSAAGHER